MQEHPLPPASPNHNRRVAVHMGIVWLLLACGIAQAGAREEVEASMQKFVAASSWHATMQIQGKQSMTNELDFTAPDRYRIKIANLGTQYIIGDSMIINMQGRTMKVPMPKGALSKYRDPAQLHENGKSMTVEALGSDSVDGKPARKYRIHNKQQGDADVMMWIGGNNYPLQIRVDGKDGVVTMHYSRFNDPTIRVQAP